MLIDYILLLSGPLLFLTALDEVGECSEEFEEWLDHHTDG
jgi:hypothetical protein